MRTWRSRRDLFSSRGFSDAKLEKLSRRPFWEKGLSPWMAWESERTGFGLGIRMGGFFPVFFPLPVKSDHYADPITEPRDNELHNEWEVYLTWSAAKAELLRNQGLRAYCVKHPWRYLGLGEIGRRGIGSLVFLPHSHGNLHTEFNWDIVREELTSLHVKHLPLVVCLGEQDIKSGLHKTVRTELGLPVVTAGELTSQFFPFRFWRLLARHRYTLGFNLASHSIYSIWAGRPFRLIGEKAFSFFAVNNDGSSMGLGETVNERILKDNPHPVIRAKMIEFADSLRKDLDEPSDLQKRVVSEFTDSPLAISRLELTSVLWFQILRKRWLVWRVVKQEISAFLKSSST